MGFRQTIEAQFCQPFLYGTSAAKTLTVSFYAKANASKTYSLSLWKRDSTAYYWFKDISVTDSWQKFTYVITPTAGSTSLITASSGAIANDNGEGLELTFVLVAGTNYDGTADTWQDSGSDAQRFYDGSIDNFLSSTDNTLRITGVQLEIGDAATDFEHLPFDIQLQRCQRYYYVHTSGAESNTSQVGVFSAYSSSNIQTSIFHPVQMRAAASADFIQSTDYFIAYGNNGNDTFVGFDLGGEGNKNGSQLYTASGRGVSVTQAAPYFVRVNGSTGATAKVAFSAEL